MASVAESELGFVAPPGTGDNWQFFSGQMKPVRVPARYKFALLVVAVAMILLPLIYLGIFAAMLWGIYWYAVHAFVFLFQTIGAPPRLKVLLLFLYLIPLLAGLLLAGFMLRPIFSRWPQLDFGVPISHVDHPLLFRFIGQLCQQMGAPIPSRIDVNVSIGASVRFREGYRSMFGNDIMMTLGLPLAASMSCREFAAVIAHELGHFTQHSAMRMDSVVGSVNRWLIRAVFVPDSLEELIDDPEDGNVFSLLIYLLAKLATGFTRGILWLLLVVGHGISSYMSRQMEVHADACAIVVSGSQGFIAMMRKLPVLYLCMEQAAIKSSHRVLAKVPDDMSAYLAMQAAQCSGQTQGNIVRQTAKDKTRWYSSHPADTERIKQAEDANEAGIINDDRSATILFNDFSKLSTEITALHYVLMNRGRPIPEDRIFHVTPQVETVPDTAAEETIVRNYFHGLGTFLRPILIDGSSRLTVSLATNKEAQIREAKRVLENADVAGLCHMLAELDAKTLRVLQWEAMGQAGLELNAETSGLSPSDAADPVAARQAIESQHNQLAAELEPLEQMARMRLTTSLGLLRTRNLASALPNAAQLHDQVTDLLHAMGKMREAFPALLEMRREYAVLQGLIGCRGHGTSVSLEESIAHFAHRVTESVGRIHAALGSSQYPFDPAERHRTIVDYARAKQYDPEPSRMAAKEGECHLRNLVALYYRLLARLTQIALEVEARLERAPASSA